MGLLDDRKSERYDFEEEVIVDEQVFTNCVDISATGLFVHTIKPMKANSMVTITIPAYGLVTKALVKHFKPGIGVGLEFIPESNAEADQIREVIDNIRLSSRKAHKKMTVLMIDGKRTIRTVYKNRLVLDGFSVAEVEDGMEAIKKMNSFHVDAVVSDLEVNRIGLEELIELIRESPDYKTIPIFVLAVPSSFEVESWVMEAGATKYLVKSTTSADDLSHMLSRTLNK